MCSGKKCGTDSLMGGYQGRIFTNAEVDLVVRNSAMQLFHHYEAVAMRDFNNGKKVTVANGDPCTVQLTPNGCCYLYKAGDHYAPVGIDTVEGIDFKVTDPEVLAARK